MFSGDSSYVVTIDGRPHIVKLRWTQPSATILTVHSVLPAPHLAIEIHSSFVGHHNTDTHATHLLLGPVGQSSRVRVQTHDPAGMQPGTDPTGCINEHITQLVDLLIDQRLGIKVTLPAVDTDLSSPALKS